MEYVPIRQTRWWPGLDQDWKARGANHLLGYNEPDHVDQANISVGDAVYSWPDLLSSGLRVGAPAVTDGGLSWLYSFIDQCDAAGLRVDFVPVHYYRSYWNAADPDGATTQFYNFLKGIYDRTKRPLWVTEFNNGANWTSDPDPTQAQQQATVAKMIGMLDNAPFVERYSIYNWVEDVRRVAWDDGSLTGAGTVYRDNISPVNHVQELPDGGGSAAATYLFDGSVRDASGNGNDATPVGGTVFTPGRGGQALSLDGSDACLQLPARLGDSTDFTFAAWVNWNGGANWQRILDLGNGTSKHLFLTPKSGSGNLRFTLKNGGGEQQLNHTAALAAGVWTHVAVTLSGDTGKLFVKGAQVNTNTGMTTNPADLGTRQNYLGKSQFAADPPLKGAVDDFRLYRRGLNPVEIAALAIPPAAVVVPDYTYGGWAAGQALTPSQSGAVVDPDTDGLSNLLEFLLGGDPLAPDSSLLPRGQVRGAAELGTTATPGKTYPSLQARARRDRSGILLAPEAAATLDALATPSLAVQAGPPVADGAYDIYTWHHPVAVEDSAAGSGFLRLRVF